MTGNKMTPKQLALEVHALGRDDRLFFHMHLSNLQTAEPAGGGSLNPLAQQDFKTREESIDEMEAEKSEGVLGKFGKKKK